MSRRSNKKIALIGYIMIAIMINPMAIAVGHLKFGNVFTESMREQSTIRHMDHSSAHKSKHSSDSIKQWHKNSANMKKMAVTGGHCDDSPGNCFAGSCCYIALSSIIDFQIDIASYGFVGIINTHKNYIPLLHKPPPLEYI